MVRKKLADPPSEKLIEEMFIAYVYLYLNTRPVFFAPTQFKEKKLAYDAKFGLEGCREIYLQFKAAKLRRTPPPQLTMKLDLSTPKPPKPGKPPPTTDLAQFNVLRDQYPAGSAFYVVPRFWDLGDVSTANLYSSPQEFLDRYVAIPVHSVRMSGNSFETDLWSPSIPYLLGHQLFVLLAEGIIGSEVRRAAKNRIQRRAAAVGGFSQNQDEALGISAQSTRIARFRNLVPVDGPFETEETLEDTDVETNIVFFRVC